MPHLTDASVLTLIVETPDLKETTFKSLKERATDDWTKEVADIIYDNKELWESLASKYKDNQIIFAINLNLRAIRRRQNRKSDRS